MLGVFSVCHACASMVSQGPLTLLPDHPQPRCPPHRYLLHLPPRSFAQADHLLRDPPRRSAQHLQLARLGFWHSSDAQTYPHYEQLEHQSLDWYLLDVCLASRKAAFASLSRVLQGGRLFHLHRQETILAFGGFLTAFHGEVLLASQQHTTYPLDVWPRLQIQIRSCHSCALVVSFCDSSLDPRSQLSLQHLPSSASSPR